VIGLDELKRRAAEAQATLETIEIDYVLAWAIWGFFQNELLKENLVFKGGTALRKIYFPIYTEYRYSEDLDFTAKTELPEDDLREAIDSSCTLAREASNIDLTLGRLNSYESSIYKAYKGRLYFIGPRRQRSRRRLNLDIDCSEEIVLSPSLLSLEHPYSDADDCSVLVSTYPLEEILGEKLRALITPERVRSRHFFDLWYILLRYPEKLDAQEAKQIFHRKCAHKDIVFKSVADFFKPERLDKYERDWEVSLKRLMPGVPPFQRVLNELQPVLQNLFG
jgi:predicted nucleotidyltransferase component of viral defense system